MLYLKYSLTNGFNYAYKNLCSEIKQDVKNTIFKSH